MTVISAADDAPLTAQIIRGGTVSPIQSALRQPNLLHLGVFDETGELLSQTIDDRHHGTHVYGPADLSQYDSIVNALDESAIYAGAFFHHYGHFLLESLARLWYAKEHPNVPIVWVGVDSWAGAPTLRQWQLDILDVLGLQNPVQILTRPTRFGTLHVPDAGYKYGDWFHPRHAEFLGAYDDAEQVSGKRIWLSRSDVDNKIGIVNSASIERSLASAGWEIVHPEQLSVRQQLKKFAEAEQVAGEEGSAFHSLILLRDVTKKKFHVFKRHGPEHLSFHTIGDVRHVNQEFHSTSTDAVIRNGGRDVQRVAPNANEVLNRLKMPVGPHPRVVGPDHATARRVKRLVERMGAESYLQVGIGDGSLFNSIECEAKVGVDVGMNFDARSVVNRTTQLFALSVRDYTAYFAGQQRFDLVLLNDCHYFEEVVDAFTAILPFTHAGTVFMIDNVVPIDEFSAMRDQAVALAQRHATGNLRNAWHGDVYKAVFLIREMFSNWSLATINTGANAVALLQSRRREARYPASNESIQTSAQAIAEAASMTYENLVDRMHQLNPTSEDDAIERMVKLG